MKKTMMFLACLVLLVGCAAEQVRQTSDDSDGYASRKLKSSIVQLEIHGRVDGDAVGYAAEEGKFYRLSQVFLEYGREEDFIKMLNARDPVVRVMAIWCLNKIDREKHLSTIKSMYDDRGLVPFMPVGCMVGFQSVGQIAKEIVECPRLLDWRHYMEDQEKLKTTVPSK